MILPVIIPVHNRLRLLQQTIDSLFTNTSIPFYLYLIDDDSDKETQQYLKSIEATAENVRVIFNLVRSGSGASRNKGIIHAYDDFPEHQFLYHSDADVYFTESWHDSLLAAMAEIKDLAIVGGRKHPHHGELGRLSGVILSDQQVGMSMLVRRKAFDAVGSKFYENTPSEMGGEDTTLCNAVRDKNWIVGSVTPPTILHCGLTNSHQEKTAGWDEERLQLFPEGVFYE